MSNSRLSSALVPATCSGKLIRPFLHRRLFLQGKRRRWSESVCFPTASLSGGGARKTLGRGETLPESTLFLLNWESSRLLCAAWPPQIAFKRGRESERPLRGWCEKRVNKPFVILAKAFDGSACVLCLREEIAATLACREQRRSCTSLILEVRWNYRCPRPVSARESRLHRDFEVPSVFKRQCTKEPLYALKCNVYIMFLYTWNFHFDRVIYDEILGAIVSGMRAPLFSSVSIAMESCGKEVEYVC